MYNYHRKSIEVRQRRLREREADTDRFLSRYEAEFADRDQRRAEREQRWELEKKEREAKLTHSLWWERVLMGMNVVLFFCAIGLLIVGAASGEFFALGGSGATGTAAVLGMLRLVLDKGSESGAHRADSTS
jgi:hypothetical protein